MEPLWFSIHMTSICVTTVNVLGLQISSLNFWGELKEYFSVACTLLCTKYLLNRSDQSSGPNKEARFHLWKSCINLRFQSSLDPYNLNKQRFTCI